MDYDDGSRTSGRVKATPEVSPSHSGRSSGPFTPPVPAPQLQSVGTFQRLAQAGQDLLAQTLRPVAAQRQQVGPVLTALALQREVGSGLTAQRQSLQRQLAEGQAALPAGAVEQALQRQAEAQGTVPALTRPPAGPGDWTQLALHEAQRVQDSARPGTTRWMNGPERERHVGTLRSAGQGLAQGFRTDRGPAAQRYAEYGTSLATLQRQTLTGGIPRMVLAQVSPAERPHLQRALDEALQRRSEQDGQDRAALHFHALQRQVSELDRQAEGSVVQRIEARRGSGQPLPEGVRRSLEAGLNHDLSGVRLHLGAEADMIARNLNALAFTSGRDIYFQAGRYEPNSQTGQELLAHEVAHVKQQAQGQVGGGLDPDAGLEAEARSFGSRYAAGRIEAGAGPMKIGSAGHGGAVQRLADPALRPAPTKPGQLKSGSPAGPVQKGPEQGGTQVQVTAQHPVRPAVSRPLARPVRPAMPRPTMLPRPAMHGPAVTAATGPGLVRAKVEVQPIPHLNTAHPPAAVHALVQGAGAATTSTARPRIEKLAVKVGPAAFATPKLDVARLKAAGVKPGEAMRAAQKRRSQSGALVGSFLKRNSAKAGTVSAMAQTLSGQVHTTALVARRKVQASAARHRSVLRAGVAAARRQASAQAGVASSQLSARTRAALAALPKSTRKASDQLKSASLKSEQAIRTDSAAQKSAVTAAFQRGAASYRAAGVTVGGEAMSHAEGRASGYLSHVTGKNDSFLDGPLTDNRWKARADAARQVGGGYQNGYAQEGGKQAETLLGGLDKDLAAIEAAETGAVNSVHQRTTLAQDRLTQDEAKARAQVQAAQASLARAIASQLQGILSQLGSSEGAGLAAIAQAAASQSAALDTQASMASRSLQRSAAQIARQLDQTLNSFGAAVRGSQAPDPAALRKALAGAEGRIDKMVSGARTQLTKGLGSVTAGLSAGAANADLSLASVARNGTAQAGQSAASFTRSSQALVTQALQTFAQLQQGHEQSSAGTAREAATDLAAAEKNLNRLYQQARDGLPAKISASIDALMEQLRKNFSQLDAAIGEQAEKAAAQVQPRWKGWVKIALMVAIIIVVAVVAGPLVIGAVGAMAGALGAGAAAGAIGMVVGGAVVGAAAGAVTQIGNNAIDNVGVDAANQKGLFDGVGKAALVGAIGGALGGAGGAVAQGLGNAGRLGTGLMTQKVAGFGVTTAFDLGGNVAGDMATGGSLTDALHNLTNPEMLMMMAIGTGVGVATTRLPGSLGRVQGGAHSMGERFGTHVGEGVANTTGYRGAPVPTRVNPELKPNTTEITGYKRNRTQIQTSSDVHPQDLAVHDQYARAVRQETSLPGQLREKWNRFNGAASDTPVGSRKWELETEAGKHADMARWRETEAARLPEASPERATLLKEAQTLRHQETEFVRQAKDMPVQEKGEGSIFHKHDALWDQVKMDSPEGLTKLKNEYDIHMVNGEPRLHQKSQSVTRQKMQFEKNPDGTWTAKSSSDTPKTLADAGIDPAAPHEVRNRQLWETTEPRLLAALDSGQLPPDLQTRLNRVMQEDLTGNLQGGTPVGTARQGVVTRMNEEIGLYIANSAEPITTLRQVLSLVQQAGSQGSIAEHLASKLYLDTEYVKTAFKNGQNGLELLERQQVIVDSFKETSQHGVEFKCGYENGSVDVTQASNYASLLDTGAMTRMDYLVMPNSSSNAEVAARNIWNRLSSDPVVLQAMRSGQLAVNYVNDSGQVLHLNMDGSAEPVTLRR